jgi:hypothetical protein
MCFEI